jgi:hypothetical protein
MSLLETINRAIRGWIANILGIYKAFTLSSESLMIALLAPTCFIHAAKRLATPFVGDYFGPHNLPHFS